MRPWFLAIGPGAIALLFGACSTGPAATPSPSAATATAPPATYSAAPSSAPTTLITSPPSAAPARTATATTPALVGEWQATYHCADILATLRDADLDEFVVESIYGNGLIPGATPPARGLPDDVTRACQGAVEVPHYHFFTADGRFGSRDARREQVDEGTYSLQGEDVVVINGQSFQYTISGHELTLVPPTVDISSCTTQMCRFGAAWVLMVALPGSTWTRTH